jgi:proteasome inhibitor subunit 1 (PI31)
MAGDILDPSAVIDRLPSLLPPSSKILATTSDAIAALVHTAMSTVDFRLIAVDDASPAQSTDKNVLFDEWNAHGPGGYTLRYRHDQSSLEFVLKLTKLGGRTLINAIAVEAGV